MQARSSAPSTVRFRKATGPGIAGSSCSARTRCASGARSSGTWCGSCRPSPAVHNPGPMSLSWSSRSAWHRVLARSKSDCESLSGARSVARDGRQRCERGALRATRHGHLRGPNHALAHTADRRRARRDFGVRSREGRSAQRRTASVRWDGGHSRDPACCSARSARRCRYPDTGGRTATRYVMAHLAPKDAVWITETYPFAASAGAEVRLRADAAPIIGFLPAYTDPRLIVVTSLNGSQRRISVAARDEGLATSGAGSSLFDDGSVDARGVTQALWIRSIQRYKDAKHLR